MFHPGETITHRFVIPFILNNIDYVIVSYRQRDNIVLEKEIYHEDMEEETAQSSSIEFTLSQEESLLFEDEVKIFIQLNVYMIGGSRHTSNLIPSDSGVQLYKEPMSESMMNGGENK